MDESDEESVREEQSDSDNWSVAGIRALTDGGDLSDPDDPFEYTLRGGTKFFNNANLADYSIHWFPFVRVHTVCFPEQHTPYIFKANDSEQYYRVRTAGSGNGFVVQITKYLKECKNPPFVATVCKVLRANSVNFSVEFLGACRCKVLEINKENGEAKLQILPDLELPHVLPRLLPHYAILTSALSPYLQRGLATRINGYPMNFIRDVTQRNIDKCMKSLNEIIGSEKAREAQNRGLTYFSYFVARYLHSNRQIEYKLLKENSADARLAISVKHFGVLEGVCAQCQTKVADANDIYAPDDANMTHVNPGGPDNANVTHVNPGGYVHRLTLLSNLRNVVVISLPSYEFSWFDGYAWVILECATCRNHVGWQYLSLTHQPPTFYGVQREGVTFRCSAKEEDEDSEEAVAELEGGNA